ncbi:MAG: glycoside hydrolase family 5 [Firmicutes bacterium]|nr:glycoside hydrolase family 5 [Bacillota bacterium]
MKRKNKLIVCILIISFLTSLIYPCNIYASAVKIVTIENINATVCVNQSYSLPKTVDALMSNNKTQKTAVTWKPEIAKTSKTGTFEYRGTVKGYPKPVILRLKVVAAKSVRPRVVVDGKVNEISGYLISGEYYFKPQEIEQAMSGSSKLFDSTMLDRKTVITESVILNNEKYIKIHDIAKAMNFSYKHDTVLDAAYIWTDQWYDESEQSTSEEIVRAEKLGIGKLPAKDQPITYQQLFKMLDRAVELVDSSKLKTWKTKMPKARKSSRTITRYNGMMAVLKAAQTIGGEYLDWNTDWLTLYNIIGEPWDECIVDSQFFNGLEQIKIGDTDLQYDAAAYFYSMGRKSLVSGNTLFDYDEAKNSMHPSDKLTCKEALIAVIRLVESKAVKSGMILLSQSGSYNKDIITDTLIARAKKQPQPTVQHLPKYRGPGCYGLSIGERIDWNEEDIRTFSEWGFNYLRVLMEYQLMFNGDITKVDLSALNKLDQLISWGMKYNVHIDFQIPDYPGWETKWDTEKNEYTADVDIYTNKKHQKQTAAMWEFLAKRYKGVPNSVLDFSVNHEPLNWTRSTEAFSGEHPSYEAVYVQVKKVIDAVRTADPDRLMFVETGYVADMDIDGNVFAMMFKNDNVVLTVKSMTINEFTYWDFFGKDDITNSGFLPDWPIVMPYASDWLSGDQSLKLNGALDKGTSVEMMFNQIKASGNLTVTDGVKEIYSSKVNRDSKSVKFTLNETAEELKFTYNADDGLSWSQINVTLPEKYAVSRIYKKDNPGKKPDFSEVKSSLIEIKPYWKDTIDFSTVITIKDDCTYTTNQGCNSLDKDTLLYKAKDWTKLTGELGVAGLTNEIELFNSYSSKDALTYYGDILSALNEYNISWNATILKNVIDAKEWGRYGIKPVTYGSKGQYSLDLELLKLLQSHQ